MIEVHLVIGPPGSGKSTLVRQKMNDGDLVVDIDLIMNALSAGAAVPSKGLLPYACAARDAVMQRIARARARDQVNRAWIISSVMDPYAVRYVAGVLKATVHRLDVEPAECVRRMTADGRPHMDELEAAAIRWWKSWHDA